MLLMCQRLLKRRIKYYNSVFVCPSFLSLFLSNTLSAFSFVNFAVDSYLFIILSLPIDTKNKCVMVSYYRFEIAISSFYVQFDIHFFHSFTCDLFFIFCVFFVKTQHEFMKTTILTIIWKTLSRLWGIHQH